MRKNRKKQPVTVLLAGAIELHPTLTLGDNQITSDLEPDPSKQNLLDAKAIMLPNRSTSDLEPDLSAGSTLSGNIVKFDLEPDLGDFAAKLDPGSNPTATFKNHAHDRTTFQDSSGTEENCTTTSMGDPNCKGFVLQCQDGNYCSMFDLEGATLLPNMCNELVKPDAFNPRQWVTASKQAVGELLPFSTGWQSCQGQTLARRQLSTMVQKIRSKYLIEVKQDGYAEYPVLNIPRGVQLLFHAHSQKDALYIPFVLLIHRR